MGWRVIPAVSVDRRRRTEDGAPYDVWESISVKPTSSVIRRKGRRGRRPLRGVREGRFQRSRDVQFTALVTMYATSLVSHSPVGCTVLGAPWLRECWAALDASVRPDRFCPRFPRRARPASTTQRFISRGHSPRTIGGRIEIEPVSSHLAAYVSQPPVRGGVLDAPRSRDRRAALDASVRPDRPHPRLPRCARFPSPPNV